MAHVLLSEPESRSTGLVTGYGSHLALQPDIDRLVAEIFRLKLDLLSLQVPLEESTFLETVQYHCIPFSTGPVRRWWQLPLQHLPEAPLHGFTLKPYTLSDTHELTLGLRSLADARYLRGQLHPIYRQFVNLHRERDALLEHLTTYHPANTDQKRGYFLMKHQAVMGLCFGHVHQGVYYTDHVMLHPDLQLREGYRTLLALLAAEARDRQWQALALEVLPSGQLEQVLEGIAGQCLAAQDLLLYPLFSYSQTRPVEQSLSARSTRSLLERTPSLRVGSKSSYRRLLRSLVGHQSYHVIQSIPLEDDHQKMTVTRVFEPGDVLIAYMYHHYMKNQN